MNANALAIIENQGLVNTNVNNAPNKQSLRSLMEQCKKLEGVIAAQKKDFDKNYNAVINAIGSQKHYFFKNKPDIVWDKETGLLWANLNTFPYITSGGSYYASKRDVQKWISEFAIDDFRGWRVPETFELFDYAKDKKNPFHQGSNIRLLNRDYWTCIHDGRWGRIDLDTDSSYNIQTTDSVYCVFPCSDCLVAESKYSSFASSTNNVLSREEKSKLALDIFINNDLWPAFTDANVTQIYDNIFRQLPLLEASFAELKAKIAELEKVTIITTDFDYLPLLAKYDVEAIEKSVIKYYEAVQKWTDDILAKLEDYEKANASIIREFNSMSIMLANKYVDNDNLTAEENKLLRDRQNFFKKKLAMGINGEKRKIYSIKQQAEALEARIDEIDEGDNALVELGEVEKEDRVSFPFLAENTAKIIRNALGKMDYFRANSDFIRMAIEAWDTWSKDYLQYKTAGFAQIRSSCEEDGIEKEVWEAWCKDWQNIRFQIEKKMQPLIERGLKGEITEVNKSEKTVIAQLLQVLADYKKDIDKVYLEDKKGIYQQYVFASGGDLQEKFETELRLYHCTVKLQTSLQKIIFNCANAEDRIFILNWANDLLDIQINELLDFVADRKLQKISEKVLNEFSELRLKNFDAYLNDAKAYGAEKERREKQYNSLMFKMRKDLMK